MADKPRLVKWQLPMRRVLYALVPIALGAVYLFGWRVLVLLAVVNAAGFLTEYAFTRRNGQPATSAVFVTSSLLVFSLPPPIPLWMAVVGVVFAVTFGKMVFGGFGKNVFNPALTGRAFLYISFGAHMTARWQEPFGGPMGGFAHYSAAGPDAITQATPGMLLKTGESIGLLDLLLGHTAGCIGGTTAILALLGGLYLVRTKTANYRIVAAAFIGFFVTQGLLWLFKVKGAPDPLHAGLAGSVMIGLFFYATDPVSASQTNEGRWIYGAFIGSMTSVIALFSAWPAGTMFAILLANMFAPIMDHGIRRLNANKPPAPRKAAAGGKGGK
jgi:Na+-transporting NADH:ubiquinone oxidoreductase subunit B